MEEARAVLERLERIEALDGANAEPAVVLDELRELVKEVEVWARRERDPRADAAAQLLADHCFRSRSEQLTQKGSERGLLRLSIGTPPA
jgi:hypothetical protein